MEAEARTILLDALQAPQQVDLSWIQQLHKVSIELGGVELPEPAFEAATAVDFDEPKC